MILTRNLYVATLVVTKLFSPRNLKMEVIELSLYFIHGVKLLLPIKVTKLTSSTNGLVCFDNNYKTIIFDMYRNDAEVLDIHHSLPTQEQINEYNRLVQALPQVTWKQFNDWIRKKIGNANLHPDAGAERPNIFNDQNQLVNNNPPVTEIQEVQAQSEQPEPQQPEYTTEQITEGVTQIITPVFQYLCQVYTQQGPNQTQNIANSFMAFINQQTTQQGQ